MTDRIKALWAREAQGAGARSPAALAQAAAALRRRTLRRDAVEYAAGALVAAVFAGYAWGHDDLLFRIGCALVIAGTAVVMRNLWRRRVRDLPAGLGETIAAHYRAQLVAQRDALASVWRWYLAPVVPGMAVFLTAVTIDASARMPAPAALGAAAIAAAAVAGGFWFIHRRNRAAAARLDKEIALLDDEPRGDTPFTSPVTSPVTSKEH